MCQSQGVPLKENGEVCPYSLFALGKFGGSELGYASDLELILIYETQGHTNHSSKAIANDHFFNELVRLMRDMVKSKSHGIFEMDFRLRPYGNDGPMSSSYKQWFSYYNDEDKSLPYEKQALLKMRPIVGDNKFSQTIMATS